MYIASSIVLIVIRLSSICSVLFNALYKLSKSFLLLKTFLKSVSLYFLFNFNSIYSAPVFLYLRISASHIFSYVYQLSTLHLLIILYIYKNTLFVYLQYHFYTFVVIDPIYVVINLFFVH